MDMISYIKEVKRQFRDTYGFQPVRGTADEPVFGKGQIPDGEYPMTIEGKVDRVRVVRDTIDCCNFEDEGINLDELQQETQKLMALLKDRQPGLTTWNQFLQERLTNLHQLTSQALGK